jgi:uncharacterized protein (TIGR02001 family)
MDAKTRGLLATVGGTILWLGCGAASATPPDTSSMPQLALPQAIAPDDASQPPVKLAFTVTGATDYLFRGVSQTENDPAIFGAARASYDNFYLGVGVENVNFHNSTNAEYDLSAGWTPIVYGFRLDLGVIRYGYIDEPSHTEIATTEAKAVVLHDFGPATLAVAAFYAGNFFGSGHPATYLEGRGSYRISRKLTLSGAGGHQTVDSGKDHWTWNGGVTYAFAKAVGLDLRYTDTDQHELGRAYGSRFTVAIKASF